MCTDSMLCHWVLPRRCGDARQTRYKTGQGLLLEREAPEQHLCLQCAIKCNWRLLYASLLFRVVRVSFLCIFLRGWLVYSAESGAAACSH